MVALTAYRELVDSQCSSLLIIINDLLAFMQEQNADNSRHGEKPVTSYHLKHFIRGSQGFKIFSSTENGLCFYVLGPWKCLDVIIKLFWEHFIALKVNVQKIRKKCFCIQIHLHYLKNKVIRNINCGIGIAKEFPESFQLLGSWFCRSEQVDPVR